MPCMPIARVMIVAVVLLASAGSAFAGPKDAKHFIVDIVAINGDEFVVKDERGTQGQIHVGPDTEKYGHFQPGDRIDAWVYPDGHARTIMILRSAATIQEDQRQAAQSQQDQQQAQR